MATGRVCTGFSKPWVAKYNAENGNIRYTDARILARGVSVNVEAESSDDNNFYADNQLAESASGVFTGGTLTLTVDGLFTVAERFIMGLPAAGEDGFTAYGDSQTIPNIGVGFIARYMSGGATSYVPTVVVKTKFNAPSTEAATQEDEIDWQTQELSAAIMRGDDDNHTWKYIGTEYDTEAAAEAALKAKLGVIARTVTQTLTHVESTYTAETVDNGAAFVATIIADAGYVVDQVTVTMGGEDITATAYDSSTNVVSIPSVSGNIVITATGVEE